MTSSGRKRSLSELLNGEEDASQLPTTRQKVDQGIDRSIRSYDSGTSAAKDDAKTPEPAFLAYPETSNRKPISVLFQQPSQLISFSYDASHIQGFDDSALRYFVHPRLRSDLSYGYDRWIKRPDERGRVDALLKAISKAKKDGVSKGVQLPEIGVVSWRGVMTKILTAPYENRDGFELNVMYLNGTLYFEEHLSEQRLQEKNNMGPRQRTQTYYGYAFESYCTTETPPELRSPSVEHARPSDSSLGWGGDVNTNVQWCSVVRTKLGDTRMILGGEVDCVRGKYTGQTDTFVELKTSLVIRGRQDEERFEKKLLKFYFQSFLLGVPEIVVGFRTPNGMLTTVQSFKTVQIPRLVRGKPSGWDPLVCLEFGHQFLGFLKNVIRDNNETEGSTSSAVWRANFVPGSGLAVAKLNAAEADEVVNGEDRVGFLPRWYWDEIQGAVQDSIRPDAANDGTSDTHMGGRSEHQGKGRQIYQ